tara:strand:- start:179 stop:2362 length:2184 start_codon:yes stop_codon:yes gene_type:complete
MKKIISTLALSILLILVSLIVILSTIGIETNKFNNLISKKIKDSNKNINLKLKKIRFKIDVEEISLFLETLDPQIDYRGIAVPAKNIKVYIDFASVIKSETNIKKIILVLNQLNIEQLKKIAKTLKPSNFTSLIYNKTKQGKLNAEIEFYLNNNLFDNYIARGSVSNLKTEITKEISLNKINFSFFADKTDVLIQNFFGETDGVKIKNGDFKLILDPEIILESNFKTNIKYNDKSKNFINLLKNFEYANNIVNLEADLNNNVLINLDETYKLKKYNFKSNGKIAKAKLDFKKPIKNNLLKKKINQLALINSEIKTSFNSKSSNTIISGKYSLNESDLLLFNLDNIIDGELLKLKLEAEYDQPIGLELINYDKPKNSIANFSINLDKLKDNLNIKEINFTEGNSTIFAKNIKFEKDKFLSLKTLKIKTIKDGKKNNDFSISYGKKISIKGTQFDATNLSKALNQKNPKNSLAKINKKIEINFSNIIAPLSKNLKNFNLIGKIEKGKFVKISAKGDYGENNFLDITMREDKKNKKKTFEIYSDLTAPLLTEYSFFKGLTGGKLLYTSVFDADKSISNLKIENFKVINAPGMVKLLSLADLGGLADLASGEGLTFDILEINMEKNNDILKLNEILALGPSVSVLMEGYQDQDRITSLRGTLVPAKNLNKIISKIPVLGDIIIPKEVGEGLFGISFKMKGPPGKIKTSINPIRTLTPRFIQKIIDKNKKSK